MFCAELRGSYWTQKKEPCSAICSMETLAKGLPLLEPPFFSTIKEG